MYSRNDQHENLQFELTMASMRCCCVFQDFAQCNAPCVNFEIQVARPGLAHSLTLTVRRRASSRCHLDHTRSQCSRCRLPSALTCGASCSDHRASQMLQGLRLCRPMGASWPRGCPARQQGRPQRVLQGHGLGLCQPRGQVAGRRRRQRLLQWLLQGQERHVQETCAQRVLQQGLCLCRKVARCGPVGRWRQVLQGQGVGPRDARRCQVWLLQRVPPAEEEAAQWGRCRRRPLVPPRLACNGPGVPSAAPGNEKATRSSNLCDPWEDCRTSGEPSRCTSGNTVGLRPGWDVQNDRTS